MTSGKEISGEPDTTLENELVLSGIREDSFSIFIFESECYSSENIADDCHIFSRPSKAFQFILRKLLFIFISILDF